MPRVVFPSIYQRRTFFVCGFACLWQHDDVALAKRLIEKIEPTEADIGDNLQKHFAFIDEAREKGRCTGEVVV